MTTFDLRRLSRTASRSGLALSALALASCGDDEAKLPSNAHDFLVNYAAIVHANYVDSAAEATELATALDTLVATPTQENLDAAREQWITARATYLQTEAFRFYEGPIDEVDDFINAWPLNEAVIDYVDGMPNAGYVNDTTFDIDGATLEALNLPEGGGESDVAVGWHAIEFLLWGQDESDVGPGDRPLADYEPTGGTANALRRGVALRTLGDLLVGHLDDLVSAWAPGADYRAQMDDGSDREALRRVLTGLSIFSGNELGGERLAAINSNEQEDEHSCFSDTTRQDFVEDAKGIENVFLGRYTRVDGTVVSGTGLYDVIHEVDATLADSLRDRIATSVSLAEALMNPFDQEIRADNAAGHARLVALQTSLTTQKTLLDAAASALGLPPAPEE